MTETEWVLRMWKYIDSTEYQKLLVGRERRLWDNTRVDILTDKWAIEVDWSEKWAEAIGQALWYASVTTMKPGICLLYKNLSKEVNNIYRCNTICAKHNIELWLIDTVNGIAILRTGERIKI